MKRTLSIAAAALSAAAVLAIPSAAHADAYCGSGYNVVAQAPVKTSSGSTYGTVYLTYNSGTGKNCVSVVKSAYVGTATSTYVEIAVKGGSVFGLSENVKYYGGPVHADARGTCVKYRGLIDSPSGTRASGGRSSWGNCG
ncbi:spore-associated protein A [Nonomuraea sp. NPDC059194]|uniref:spore-associated protein A n=1 Tax=Nonomuraea sp. NPDC059194 TaxID=3346764 RepID=UPI00369368EA